jgi:antitoxin component of MazEF toxin-antitoxin module
MPQRQPIPNTRYTKITSSGHSLVVVLPRQLLEQLGWRRLQPLEVWLSGDCLVLAAAASRRNLVERVDVVEAGAGLAKRGDR